VLQSILAAARAVYLGLLFSSRFRIRFGELNRYLRKCLNLGLCYGAFTNKWSVIAAVRAGDAAFLCCVYDVASDWRGFENEPRTQLEKVLHRFAPKSGVDLALDLFEMERTERLSADGLERGVLALQFVAGLAGSTDKFQRYGIDTVGRLLQMIDDILDIEEDIAHDDQNCFLGPRRILYLAELTHFSPFLEQVFSRSSVMLRVIEKASLKAQKLLENELPS